MIPFHNRLLPVVAVGLCVALLGCANAKKSDAKQQQPSQPQKMSWGEFPASASPADVGRRITDELMARERYYITKTGMAYPEVCTAYGALRISGATQDKDRVAKLVKRYERMWDPTLIDGRPFVPVPDHVDPSVFGILPLEIYRQAGEQRYLDLGKKIADAQWAKPIEGNITDQARWWIDDMFMITALQTQAFRATKDPVYLDRAATAMVAYLDKLQQPNGLFHHGVDSPFFWGRGNGWVAAGLAELLSELPAAHAQRPRVLEGYRKMMAALKGSQAEDGMWRQLLDKPDSWKETSCTGMFTFAMAQGVRHGWLDAGEYKEPTRKAWTALATYVDEKGQVREVCIGTNKGKTTEFYMERPRRTGDFHGQAGVIWAAWAMLDW